MGFVKEFKEFALKGNLVDMAVGIVIGGAFAGIVKSFMDNLVSPVIGLLAGKTDFSDLTWPMGTGEGAAVLKYGAFFTTVIDFLIVAMAIFIAIKFMNSLKKKAEAAPSEPTAEVKLLTEIRDSLKK